MADVRVAERRARSPSRSFLLHGSILALLVVYAAPIFGVILTSLQTNAEIPSVVSGTSPRTPRSTTSRRC